MAIIISSVQPICAIDRAGALDSLYTALSKARTATDSVPILFNIYDCVDFPQRGEALENIYVTAKRAGNYNAQLDAMILLASFYEGNDSIQHLLNERVNMIPESDAQKSTAIYIRLRQAAKDLRMLPEKKRQQRLREYLSRYDESMRLNLYDRIEYLFYLLTCVRSQTDGDLLIRYTLELQELIDQLPSRALALRALFYNEAALSYLGNDMYDEAVVSAKKMLDVNKEYDKIHAAAGREFRSYAGSTYFCYNILLMCHKSLTPDEVDYYYTEMQKLKEESPRFKTDSLVCERTEVYYLMAKKQYAKAIPAIQALLNKKNSRVEYKYLIEALIEASEATGNKDVLLFALKANAKLLQRRIETKAAESYKELQIVYEMIDLKEKNDVLANENHKMGEERHKELMTYSFIVIAIIMCLLLIVYGLYHKTKHLANRLASSNELLIGERDALKKTHDDLVAARDKAKAADRIKTDFVNNMSHEIRTPLTAIVEYSNLISDCASEDKRGYIKRFADIISLNTDLLLTLVNDVLELPSLENAKLTIHNTASSVHEMCRLSIDSVKKHLKKDVKLVFANENDNDAIIYTDPHRTVEVLLNLLSNAAKFTEKGSIELAYKFSDDNQSITFSVTDTGIGIPRGKSEIIFSRFEKLNSETQGNGLGLYIARLLAGLLKGSLRLDTDYRKGARFLFTIPTK